MRISALIPDLFDSGEIQSDITSQLSDLQSLFQKMGGVTGHWSTIPGAVKGEETLYDPRRVAGSGGGGGGGGEAGRCAP